MASPLSFGFGGDETSVVASRGAARGRGAFNLQPPSSIPFEGSQAFRTLTNTISSSSMFSSISTDSSSSIRDKAGAILSGKGNFKRSRGEDDDDDDAADANDGYEEPEHVEASSSAVAESYIEKLLSPTKRAKRTESEDVSSARSKQLANIERIAGKGRKTTKGFLGALTRLGRQNKTHSPTFSIFDGIKAQASANFREYLVQTYENLRSVIFQMSGHHQRGFTKLFSNLAGMHKGISCSIARSKHNLRKCRYRDIVAYDETRATPANGSFINASLIKGIGGSYSYIASQGPMASTVEDFWSMVWKYNSRVIVMLTRLKEGEKEKCHRYWPENVNEAVLKPKLITGDITVKHVSTQVLPLKNYVERKFVIKQGGTRRAITHFQYLGWPDHSVPTRDVGNFLNFLGIYKTLMKTKKQGPPVVHCSAGVGRTGTFIALDMLTRRINDRFPDIEENVEVTAKSLRSQRMWMIQSKEQLKFVYETLLDYLKSSIDVLDSHLQSEL